LTLFRMGVLDYLGRREHPGRLAGVVASVLSEGGGAVRSPRADVEPVRMS
jgi:hypothetical protein